ncbi:UNVERIFIED_CONTAM: Phosphatidylinositol 4-phosphate 5-kinase [Sesamum radiatum]|uniref:1-phosphatidylinositol-4-phosphate 5-kinase n=1 Tax=Sesamum radiatum TaxID=300843 RepID=A0AAW2SGU2_SESRA
MDEASTACTEMVRVVGIEMGIRQFRRMNPAFSVVEVKSRCRQYSRHKNYDLNSQSPIWVIREKFWTRFPPEGSKNYPGSRPMNFINPMVTVITLWWTLRELFQVDPADYAPFVGNDALRELSSPGKSGSFFYLTQDDRLNDQDSEESEVKVLIKMLPSPSVICRCRKQFSENNQKFYGVHCVKPSGGRQ